MNNDIEIRIDDDRNIDVDMSNELIEKVVVQADWNENNPNNEGYIKNKPNLSNVATSGDYEDLSNKPTIPTKTSDLTNDSDFVDSNYVNGKIDDLKWELGANDLSLQTDTTVAYTKTVPIGAIGCKLNKLGFMSYKSENEIKLTNQPSGTQTGITYSIVYGIIPLSGTATQNMTINLTSSVYFNGTYTFKNFGSQALSNNVYFVFLLNGEWTNPITIKADEGTITLNGNYIFGIAITGGTTVNGTIKPMLVKGTTAPTEYQPYFEGIRDSIVTSIKSYDSNNNLIDTYTIPSEIQALEGYGRGINSSVYNVLDLNTKVFTDKDSVVDLGTLAWTLNDSFANVFNCYDLSSVIKPGATDIYANILMANYSVETSGTVGNVDMSCAVGGTSIFYIHDNRYSNAEAFKQAMNGVNLQYELTTYNTTDNLELPNNVIEVEAGGYIVFENQYGQAVPSDITYLIEVAK